MTERILLVGMMGSGKTTVGRALAERLACPFLDSDEQVERATGRTVAQIFAEQGEAAFRRQEQQALREALAVDGPVVVAVAGGAVLDPDNRRRLKAAGFVVWLEADASTLAERVGEGGHRPLLAGDPLEALAGLYEERRPLYAEVADLVVDADGPSAEEVVDQIVEHVRIARSGAR